MGFKLNKKRCFSQQSTTCTSRHQGKAGDNDVLQHKKSIKKRSISLQRSVYNIINKQQEAKMIQVEIDYGVVNNGNLVG